MVFELCLRLFTWSRVFDSERGLGCGEGAAFEPLAHTAMKKPFRIAIPPVSCHASYESIPR